MVWRGISFDGSTDLFVTSNSSLNGVRYRDENIDHIVRPYTSAIDDDFVLMDNNVRLHRAGIVNEYLARETIESMDWPAYLPDLNPIEHSWDLLQRQIAKLPVAQTTVEQLADALVKVWRQIPQQKFTELLILLSGCCEGIGGDTQYKFAFGLCLEL